MREKDKVRVVQTGKTGVVNAIMPDAHGAPCCIHVKLDDEVAADRFALPLVVALDEIEPIEPTN